MDTERIRANAWGRYYTTGECDACGECAVCAPDNIAPSWDGSFYAVAFQPASEREEAQLQAAMAVCPRFCIRDDGEI